MKTTRHHITSTCAGVHCHTHEVDEPANRAFIVCFECGHVYRTRVALWWTHLRVVAGMFRRDLRRPLRPPAHLAAEFGWDARWPRVASLAGVLHALVCPPSRISFCQHCIHDF